MAPPRARATRTHHDQPRTNASNPNSSHNRRPLHTTRLVARARSLCRGQHTTLRPRHSHSRLGASLQAHSTAGYRSNGGGRTRIASGRAHAQVSLAPATGRRTTLSLSSAPAAVHTHTRAPATTSACFERAPGQRQLLILLFHTPHTPPLRAPKKPGWRSPRAAQWLRTPGARPPSRPRPSCSSGPRCVPVVNLLWGRRRPVARAIAA